MAAHRGTAMMFSRILLLLVLAALLPGPTVGRGGVGRGEKSTPAPSRGIAPGWRRTLARYDVRFEEDGTSRTVFDFEVLLTERKGLEAVAQQVYGYNAYFAELTVSDL